ncbi:terribly reduced optic lobes isoform X13 [Nomia melanderi]|uniref:terribly reduced optic lobes isoform X13 n=1 Tax=Nomia melanderi TaxID=2448451 RepID=UPI003FCE578E
MKHLGSIRHCLPLLLVLAGVALAAASENDDLVFDQDGKQSYIETPLIESRQQESFLHRIKRNLFSIFNPLSTNTTTEPPPEFIPEEDEEEAKEEFDHKSSQKSTMDELARVVDDAEDDEEETDENNQIGNAAETRREPARFANTDDEDLTGSGGFEGSAEDEKGAVTGKQRRYYRITLTIGEPYLSEYADRNSPQYKKLSANLTQALEELYNQLSPDHNHHASVVKISPIASDIFKLQVTMDIGLMFSDEIEVRNIIEEQLQRHSLGNIQLYPEGFTFRIFQVGTDDVEEECDKSTELRCRNGACVPLDARCDGVAQCDDKSDELDCPTITSVPYLETEEPEEVTITKDIEGTDDGPDDVTLTPVPNKCRADDTVRCKDGSHYICSVQLCDGIQDCNDGSDEIDCDHPGCSVGEFACDVSRCILESQRCNHVEDCNDGSDEHDCNYPACSVTQFSCRNGQCIDIEARCNGVQDCHDNSDERNCLTTCSNEEYQCIDGTCISMSKRCDHVPDCRNGEDERQCGCGEAEFRCADGWCIGYELQCNGVEECSDGSDERDCEKVPWRNVYNDRAIWEKFMLQRRNMNRDRTTKNWIKEELLSRRPIRSPRSVPGVEKLFPKEAEETNTSTSTMPTNSPSERSSKSADNLKKEGTKVQNEKQKKKRKGRRRTKNRERKSRRKNMKNDSSTDPLTLKRKENLPTPVSLFLDANSTVPPVATEITQTIHLSNYQNIIIDRHSNNDVPTNAEERYYSGKYILEETLRSTSTPEEITTMKLEEETTSEATLSTQFTGRNLERSSMNVPEEFTRYTDENSEEKGEEITSEATLSTQLTERDITGSSSNVPEEATKYTDEDSEEKGEEITSEATLSTQVTERDITGSSSNVPEEATKYTDEDPEEKEEESTSEATLSTQFTERDIKGTSSNAPEEFNKFIDEDPGEKGEETTSQATLSTQFTERNLEKSSMNVPEELKDYTDDDPEKKEDKIILNTADVTRSFEEYPDSSFRPIIPEEHAEEDPEEDASMSREDIYGFKAKKRGDIAYYYHKYLEGSVTPSATTVPTLKTTAKWTVKQENSLFESNGKNSNDTINLLSKDRSMNKSTSNSSVVWDENLKKNISKCDSDDVTHCDEYSKSAHEENKRNESLGSFGEEDVGNVDSGLLEEEEKLEKDKSSKRTTLDPTLKEESGTWDTSYVTRTTVSPDLVEQLTSRNETKPGKRGKKGGKKQKDKKGDKNKNKDKKKQKEGKNQRRKKDRRKKIEDNSSTTVDYSTIEYSTPNQTSSFFTKPEEQPSMLKHKENITDQMVETSSASAVTDLPTLEMATKRCKNNYTKSISWPWDLPRLKDDCEEDNTDKPSTNSEEASGEWSTASSTEDPIIREELWKPSSSTKDYSCNDDEFLCDQVVCKSSRMKCDGKVDCRDATDESNCVDHTEGSTGYTFMVSNQPKCEVYEFICDGRCVSNLYSCDGIPQCSDGRDEVDCEDQGKRECTPTQFKCLTGKCIEGVYRCDGRPDCPDHSDEDCANETITHVTQPTTLPWPGWTAQSTRECDPSREMRCDDGKCVLLRRKCDNIFDCLDGSDELGCGVCTPAEWKCASGECLPEIERCDGVIQCADGSDEDRCVNECPAGMFRCNDGLCIDSKKRCDGRPHCRDRSDEIDCASPGSGLDTPTFDCPDGELPCKNGICINKNFFCDQRPDCLDGSDESDCPGHGDHVVPTPAKCRPDEFLCSDGSCIPQYAVCDRRVDCPNRDDESNCPQGCGKDQFQCTSGECIRSDQKCNTYIECSDGSDEEGCDRPGHHPMPGRCPAGYIMCTTDKDCVPQSSICNGVPECRDRSDEENCDPAKESSHLNLKTYPSEQVIKENPAKQGREVVFQCRDEGPMRARVRWLRGNNLPLPPGSRDINGRLEIPNIQMDHSGSYICEAVGYPPSTSGQQVTVYLTVEKLELPSTSKPYTCGYDEATCNNRECIPKSYVCNGRIDCTDGSDEMRCSPHGCEPNEYRCNNTECVSKVWRCDGDKDCADGSDEENCVVSRPGSPCRSTEFACNSGQCIPKSFQCDLEKDCIDGTDEIGCSPVYIIKPPPPMITLERGAILIITCTAIGVPTPEINWRLNWGHIPSKCTMTSVNGTGTLTCPDIQPEDQGAYSCEGINIAGFVFAVPDAIVMVEKPQDICPKGMFNSEARSVDECISCFCFGVATECRSANLFTYKIPPPLDHLRVVFVEQRPAIRIISDVSSQQIEVTRPAADSIHLYTAEGAHDELIRQRPDDSIPYFALPEHYHGSQLKSYGGYLKYRIRYNGTGTPNSAPAVILMGNNYVLVHKGKHVPPYYESEESVRFFQGEWFKKQGFSEVLATREDIMMTLARVDNILIKVQYDDSPLDVHITKVIMDTADVRNTGLGSASYVEECECPSGYSGLSCEQCAPGFLRRETGPWLGQCYQDEQPCPPGYYGDPSRNIPCQVCPCPLTNPSNQFARTCHLSSDGQPTCDCPPGYIGRRCQQCDTGYQGNPLRPGDMCIPSQRCDPNGSLSTVVDPVTKLCRCKQFATGPTCNQCKANTFNLASANQFGCISCFCMGITNKCVSSNWYRSEIRVSFTNSIRGFSLIESKTPDAPPIVDGIRLDTIWSREIIYDNFPNRGNNDVYYWQLPNIFLGDQIASYGGNLKYTIRYVPAPGGQSSRNNAADVELISANDINLLYFSRESPEPNTPQTFTVPLLEQYWQRNDGTKAERDLLLMALADVRAIRIKATYTTHTDEAALSLVSLDSAEKHNTGKSRAVEVEECSCPPGYKGLSCEDCDVGYTRANEGLYLGICEPCNCNGHSNHCNPDTGVCEHCAHHTTGDFCEVCEPGYEGDATRGTPYDCDRNPGPSPCNCNPAGSRSSFCIGNRCDCKRNVDGPECNRCRPSTFGLSADNPDGCIECYCSGVTDQCHESSLYAQQIPVWVYDVQHGFTLTDATRQEVIDDGFELNIAMNEIGYRYSAGRGRRLFWSLPPVLTGNKVKSYGGNLTLTQHITAAPNSLSYKDQDIILIGNGITLFWTNPVEIQPDVPMTYSVPLRESEWKRLTTEGPRVASRLDLMTVLSNLEAILVRASHSERMTATYISDISLDTAVEVPGSRRAVQVEVCRCPTGYTGTSCESCARGYYRDIEDRSVSYLGSCQPCPCNRNEESCEISRTGQVKCHCQPGYTGQYCQDDGEVMVSLTPMMGEVKPFSWIMFTCSYKSSKRLRISFKLSPYRGAPLTATSTAPGPTVTTEDGAYRTWHVYVQLDPCNVECFIQNNTDKELIRVVTAVLPEHTIPTTTVSYPAITPPTIVVYIKGPEFQIVKTGSTVRYHCSGRSLDNESVQVKWEKEGGQLPPGRSVDDSHGLLIIRDVKVSDSGIYVCEVSDGVHIAFKNVTLTVGSANPVSPRAVIAPPSLEVSEGEPAEFRCDASGNPTPQIDWIRVQGSMNPEVIIQNGVWTLRAVSRNDAAEYKCIARNNVGVDERTAILYVRENPNKPPGKGRPPTITPSEWTGTVGEMIRITCTPTLIANVTWTREGNLSLPSSARQRDGVLIIMNPSIYDSGIYVCTSVSFVGTEASSIININVQPMRAAPSVKVKPEKQTVPQGSVAEVRCLTSGEPGLQIRWNKYQEAMSPNTQQVGDSLRIVNVQISDRGVYVCKVSGPTGSQEASAIIEVEPREAPRLELYPMETQAVILGGSADVQCRAVAGTPTPELHWSRNDGRPFANNIKQLPGGVLRLSNITITDGGAYICSATNSVGSTSAIAYIEVHTLPVINITPQSGILNVKRGEEVRLVCSATGNPQPNVEWSKHVNGMPFYSSTLDMNQKNPLSAVYEIFSVSHNDEGSYTCHAMNAAGMTEERVYIHIEDNEVYSPCGGDIPCTDDTNTPPPDYDPPDKYFKIPNGGKVEMRCQVYVSSGNHIYLDWKRSDRRPLPEGNMVHNGVLTIPAVDKSAAGEYVCLGMDQAGNVLFRAKSHLEVSSPPRIVLNPPRQTVGPGENPSIVCSATGDEPMSIEWAAIGRDLPYSVSHDHGILQFHGITYSDAGKYVCKASNEAGTAEAVAEVLVNEHPYEEAGVKAAQRDVVTYAGSPVRLQCLVQERATIHWSRENQGLPANARIADDYLELPRAKPEDSGRYICRIQTVHGVSSDYINLNVSLVNIPPDCTRANQTHCGQRECICGVQGCILLDFSCHFNVRYLNNNSDYSDNIGGNRHYLQQRRATVMPAVSVEVSQDPVNIGDTIDIRCACTGTHNPRYHWSRPHHLSLPPNAQEYGNTLRLSSVTVDNSGLYRCTAETPEGIFDQDFNLVVHGGHNDAPAIETKYAPYGSSIEMNCKPNLDPPLQFHWSKLGGLLPRDTQVFESKWNLTKVKVDDAGTYICTANNDQESIEIPTVLVVTGVVPYFSQAPESFIALPPLPDSYLKFNIEISFKPESYDGIILYNDESSHGNGDFVMLSLVRGYPHFSFDLGSGPTVIRADKPVTLSEWHTIKLQRNRKEGSMLVDGTGPYKGVAVGRKQGLDVKELMYIGGVPADNTINKHAEVVSGFVGCISRLVIGEKEIDLNGNQAKNVGITNCETCAENPCNNGGVCQEAATKNGYTCLCRAGYSGKHCDYVGQTCYPGACGEGKCVENERGFDCYCPYGKTGSRCENSMKVYEPAFHDDKSFVAHDTPKALRRARMSTTHSRLRSRNVQVRTPRSRPHHHNNLHHTKH